MADCPINNENLSASNPGQSAPSSSIINTDTKGISGGVGSGTSSLFDVNKIAAAAQQYNAMNGLANEMFGYAVKWFRAVPQQRSKDVIFQEYTLSNVDECPLDIKVIIAAGNMPDSKYSFDLQGLEYEVPLEFQIDKHYWEGKAGFGTAPQKNDIVYFPMENKLYDVESSYLFRGFMGQETTWKLNLTKHKIQASRREGVALQNTIDQYTVSAEEIFGTQIANDISKLVDDKQFSPFNGTSQDKYKTFDSALKAIPESFSIYGTIVAQSFYDMATPVWYNAMTYNQSDTIYTTTDRSLTAWIHPKSPVSAPRIYDVTSITSIGVNDTPHGSANYSVTINTSKGYDALELNSTIVISRPGALNLYAKVIEISTGPLVLHCFINSFVLEDLSGIKSDWNTQPGYKLYAQEPISILDGVNDYGDHVMSVNVHASQYISINYGHSYSNDDAYVIRMDEKILDNEWYAFVVNIGNTWEQYSAYVWKKHPTDKNAKLQNIFYETLRLYPEDIAVKSYTINKSDAYLTNLRLYTTTIEEEKQSNELLSYFIKDGDSLVLSDNADPIMMLPYITKSR
jgi:hypothetical protein